MPPESDRRLAFNPVHVRVILPMQIAERFGARLRSLGWWRVSMAAGQAARVKELEGNARLAEGEL